MANEKDIPILHTENLSVGYDGKTLIADINMSALKGKITTIIGPNGAGKTTILKSIVGLLKINGGNVYIEDDDLSKLYAKDIAKKLAVVLTNRPNAELMTVRDVVETGRYPYTGIFGMLSETDNNIVQDALDMTGTIEIADKDFLKISDGQKQRVMLARAICQEPEAVVLDEPTSYLDVRYKLEFMNTLQKLAREKNVAVIMSLHELDLARRVSDTVICIKGDKVDKIGAPWQIFEEDYIRKLFDVQGSCDELSKPAGETKVFVIAGGGSGSDFYRRLQRDGVSFATGIIYENDIDYPVAKALANEVISVKAFEMIDEEIVKKAINLVDKCDKVYMILEINSDSAIAKSIKRVYNYALEQGKIAQIN